MVYKTILKRAVSFVLAVVIIFSAASAAVATVGKYSKSGIEATRMRYSEKIVEIARAEIGYYEGDINKFTTWYYGTETESSWCCIFVSWCADQAGVIETAIPQRNACSSMRNYFVYRDLYYPADSDYVPRKGDIVFYNTACDDTDEIHHVEIITEDGFHTKGKTVGVYSIGGNTSNQYYSGCTYVMEKFRPVDGPRAQVVGYCHPEYEKSDGLRGKFYTFTDDIRNEDMKYIHSRYIVAIYHLENYWNNFIQMLRNARIEVEDWFANLFNFNRDDEAEEETTTSVTEVTTTEPAEETTTQPEETTNEPVTEEKKSWFKKIFCKDDKEEESVTEEVTEVTEVETEETTTEVVTEESEEEDKKDIGEWFRNLFKRNKEEETTTVAETTTELIEE